MRGRLFALVATILLVVTGCRLDVDVHVAMERDGSGVVTVTAVADAELVARAPGLAADLRLDVVGEQRAAVLLREPDGRTALGEAGHPALRLPLEIL